MRRHWAEAVALAVLVAASPLLTMSDPPAQANPGFSFKQSSFTKSTGAAPVTQSITGVGFQPKAVMFFWTRQTATGSASHVQAGYGFATGPTAERAIAIASDDAVATSNTGKRQSQQRSIILLSSGTPTLGAQAELLSFDADGFTISWITNEARADIIHYVALGGADLINALASSFTVISGAGTQAITGVGFQPAFVMMISIGHSTVDSNLARAGANVGFASGPAARGTISVTLRDPLGTTDTCVRQRTDRFISELSNGCGDKMLADFVSFDPDGFTINKTNADDATLIHYLALKGGKYKVGAFNKSTGTAPVNQSVASVGFQPVGLILASINLGATASIVAEGRISLGAADGATEGATWFHDKDAQATSDANQRTSTDKIAVHASQTTLSAEADQASFDLDGFTLNWNPNNAIAEEILYVAFGNAVIITQSLAEGWQTTDSVTLTAMRAVGESWATGDSVTKLATRGAAEAWTSTDATGTNGSKDLPETWATAESLVKAVTKVTSESWATVETIATDVRRQGVAALREVMEGWRTADRVDRVAVKDMSEAIRWATTGFLAATIGLRELWTVTDAGLLTNLKSLSEAFGVRDAAQPATIRQPAELPTPTSSYVPWLVALGIGVGMVAFWLIRRRRREAR